MNNTKILKNACLIVASIGLAACSQRQNEPVQATAKPIVKHSASAPIQAKRVVSPPKTLVKTNKLIVETTTSWCFVGEGLRLSMELLGPEYSMFINTLDPDLKLFFSRKVTGSEGEDLVEKQNAESGSMPVISNEVEVYGYTAENRHMVESFLAGKRPEENFDDGLDVTRLLMAAYMSAEQGKTIRLPNPDIDTFIPAVARGEWNPKS